MVLENAGTFLSLGSTVAIIFTLVVYHHQPVPVLRYGITLTTLLAMLSTFTKAYHEADAISTSGWFPTFWIDVE